MNWISAFKHHLYQLSRSSRSDNQTQLVLLVCLPCLVVAAISMIAANISGYLIAFILIILVLLASYVVVASKQSSQYQIRTLSNLIESMIDGDYSLRGRLQTNQAYQELLNLINDLADTLAKHKTEAKESRLLLERIMEQMDAMVLASDQNGYIVMANASANKLILDNADSFQNVKLDELSVGAKIAHAQSGIIDFKQPELTGEFFLFTESFLSEGKPHQLYMLTNAERLLMEKERSAWQSLLRVLSHEMNNSLAPIAAISQSMQKKLKTNTDLVSHSLLDGVNIINERAESLSQFIASYSALSHLPNPNKTQFSLKAMVNSFAALYPDTHIDCVDEQDCLVFADKHQFEQVLINLFKNAVEAMSENDEKSVIISTKQGERWLKVYIEDNGQGIANIDNVFVPFYTTKKQGSGIGLALCRQILFNHDGMIAINNNPDMSGVKVTLSLPKFDC